MAVLKKTSTLVETLPSALGSCFQVSLFNAEDIQILLRHLKLPVERAMEMQVEVQPFRPRCHKLITLHNFSRTLKTQSIRIIYREAFLQLTPLRLTPPLLQYCGEWSRKEESGPRSLVTMTRPAEARMRSFRVEVLKFFLRALCGSGCLRAL